MTDKDDGNMQSFDTGATRDTATGKIDMEGFTHPMVMRQFAKYMSMNRVQSDGQLRDSDNWQKGISLEAYMKSLTRHKDDVWAEHRGFLTEAGLIAALCGVMFNAMGYLHEVLKRQDWVLQDFDGNEPTPEMLERRVAKEEEDKKRAFLEATNGWGDSIISKQVACVEDSEELDQWYNSYDDRRTRHRCGWDEQKEGSWDDGRHHK